MRREGVQMVKSVELSQLRRLVSITHRKTSSRA